MKPAQVYLIQVWCCGVAISPIIATILLIKNISSHDPLEIPLIIGLTMMAGLAYLIPALALAYVVAWYISESSKNIKLITAACLIVLLALQLSLVYKWNLSFIYKGGGVTALTYLLMFMIAAYIIKLKQAQISNK